MPGDAEPAPKAPPLLAPTKRVMLDTPIKLGEVEYSSLELREPTAGEVEAIDDKSGVAWTMALVHQVSALPMLAVRKLPVRVLNECAEYLVPFTRNVRPTGTDG